MLYLSHVWMYVFDCDGSMRTHKTCQQWCTITSDEKGGIKTESPRDPDHGMDR